MSVACSLPCVRVPVLSNTTQSSSCAVSSASPDFTNIPFSAALPVPTIIATGVANPNAHGHDITSTAIADDRANSTVAPAKSHTIAVNTDMPITIGTNIPETLSASLAIGARELPASCTSLIISANIVSSPTLVARRRMKPLRLIVA